MGKPRLSLDIVETFLQGEVSEHVTDLEQLTEGEESQAFSFSHAGKEHVIRINPSIKGFEKDAYAYRHFNSPAIPVPEVVRMGYVDRDHAFCISEKMPGITLQDLDPGAIEPTLKPTLDLWWAIGSMDVDDTTGFGDFASNGAGRYPSWRSYLLSILDPARYDWDSVMGWCDSVAIHTLIDAFCTFVPACLEERRLVHGDFGSNNILTDGQRITAVLDWDCAKYGDSLYDVAGAYFWGPWLDCMQAFADYCERSLCSLPNFRERIWCYQLRCGLDEIYGNAHKGDAEWTGWALRRSLAIVDEIEERER